MDNFDVELAYVEMLEDENGHQYERKNDYDKLSDDNFKMRYRYIFNRGCPLQKEILRKVLTFDFHYHDDHCNKFAHKTTGYVEYYKILSKIVVKKILEIISPELEFPTERNTPLTPLQQLLVTLRFYATGSFQLTGVDLGGVSKSTVCRCVKKVSKALAQQSTHFIFWPNEGEQRKVVQQFYHMGGFPGVIGAIDCTHIPIKSPGGELAKLYRNRKGYFSVNVQTVSDANLMIRNIVARWQGSVHDSTIFNNSLLKAKFEGGQLRNCHLLGDNGYKLTKYLLTPFLSPSQSCERNYNRAHIKCRNVVERQYGVWKRRFPALQFGLRTKLDTSLTVIVATAVLHNIAMSTGDIEPPQDLSLKDFFERTRLNINVDNLPAAMTVQTEGDAFLAAQYRRNLARNHFV